MIYEIAISKIPLRKSFLYQYSGELESGERVLVSFNSRDCVGYVLCQSELSDNIDLREIKEIKERIDGLSFVNPRDVELIKWVARHFYSPIGQLFDMMIPAFVDDYAKTMVESTSELIPLESMSLSEFISKYGEKTLKMYLKKGYIKLRRIFAAKQPRPRVGNLYLFLNKNLEEAILTAKSPDEYDVLNYLFANEGATVNQVVESTGVTVKKIRKMMDKGLLRASDMPSIQSTLIEKNRENQLIIDDNEPEKKVISGGTVEERFNLMLPLIKNAIESGRSVLYLVPLSSQIPYIAGMVQKSLDVRTYVYHGNLSKSQKALVWISACKGETGVYIGTRNTVFLPIKKLGAIVVENDEDESYYQFEEPVFDCVEVAQKRAFLYDVPLILSSASGRLDDFSDLENSCILKLQTSSRNVILVDMKKQNSFLSDQLVENMRKVLNDGKNILLLTRRKGYSPFVRCLVCGYTVLCPNCDVAMSFHKSENLYKCHQCGYVEQVSDICPKCGAHALYPKGFGTERIERLIKYNFPSARVARIDRDTTNFRELLNRLFEFQKGELDILVGTRIILHGFTYPKLGLLGFVDIDSLLFQPDYNSKIRVYQQLRQGLQMAPNALMVIQTAEPDSDLIKYLFSSEYCFYQEELERRKSGNYPPYSFLVQVVLESDNPSIGWDLISSCVDSLRDEEVLGPVEHPVFKLKGKYRFHFLIKTRELDDTLSKLDGKLNEIGWKGWRVFINPPHLW